MRVAEKWDWKGLKIKKSVGNKKIIMSDEVRQYDFPVPDAISLQVTHQPLSRPKLIRAGEYVSGRKIGLERVKDQEKRREQENHNVGRGPT
jgi:hypothetical protein